MTYIVEKPAISFTGIKRSSITIEFTPNIHSTETEYSYEHPQFAFGDRVSIINTYPELEFTVRALELIESKTPSGRLLNQPYWKYKVSNGQVSHWKDETALTRYTQKTCSSCNQFRDHHEPNGKGWCKLFDQNCRKHHEKTNDCVVNGALDKSNEAFPTEIVELDRDGYPIEEAEPTGYFATDFVTNSNEPF